MKRNLASSFLLVLSLLLISQVIALGSTTTGNFAAGASDSTIKVHFIDVGQGDSVLIDTPGTDVLVDGGPTAAGSIVLNYLNQQHITHLGIVVATHMDADHIGGLINVLGSTIQVDQVLANNMTSTTQTYKQFAALAKAHTVTAAQRDQTYTLTSTVNLTVLSPTQPLSFGSQNENSVVLKLQAEQVSFLLEGDAGTDAEQSMINAGLSLHCNVLKVGHHGSTSATSEAFLNSSAPNYAIISCALNNSYGHPAPSTVQRLTSHNIATYGTYDYGTITATTDGTSVTLTAGNTQLSSPTPTITTTPLPTKLTSPTPSPDLTPSMNTSPTTTPSVPESTNTAAAILITSAGAGACILLVKQRQKGKKRLRN